MRAAALPTVAGPSSVVAVSGGGELGSTDVTDGKEAVFVHAKHGFLYFVSA